MGQCAVTDVDVRPHCALNDSCDCEQTCTKSDHRDGLIDLVQHCECPGSTVCEEWRSGRVAEGEEGGVAVHSRGIK